MPLGEWLISKGKDYQQNKDRSHRGRERCTRPVCEPCFTTQIQLHTACILTNIFKK